MPAKREAKFAGRGIPHLDAVLETGIARRYRVLGEPPGDRRAVMRNGDARDMDVTGKTLVQEAAWWPPGRDIPQEDTAIPAAGDEFSAVGGERQRPYLIAIIPAGRKRFDAPDLLCVPDFSGAVPAAHREIPAVR